MRRTVLVLMLAVAAVLAAQARGASPKVAALQVALFQRGYYHKGFDGVAGPVTRAATKRFQRRHHLVADGIAGPRTRAALGRWGRHELGARELRRGRRGWDVAELQFLLRRNGISISLDGISGPATQAAVIGSQRLRPACKSAYTSRVRPRALVCGAAIGQQTSLAGPLRPARRLLMRAPQLRLAPRSRVPEARRALPYLFLVDRVSPLHRRPVVRDT
jgi:putative peptidoglycan binding protein